jgi:N-acetylmuramoyl-L-alanine amidase
MRDIKYIVIHCTAGNQSQSIDSIKAYWKSKGWKSVGYHKIIESNGKVTELAEPDSVTNGVRGHNFQAYHICWVGGLTGDNRTLEQKVSLAKEIKEAQEQFPDAEVVGHRDLSPDLDGDGVIESHEWVKLCPQFDVKDFLKQIEKLDDYIDLMLDKMALR